MNSIQAEKNRNRRRDTKRSKRRTGMRTDDSARKLALVKRNRTPHLTLEIHLGGW